MDFEGKEKELENAKQLLTKLVNEGYEDFRREDFLLLQNIYGFKGTPKYRLNTRLIRIYRDSGSKLHPTYQNAIILIQFIDANFKAWEHASKVIYHKVVLNRSIEHIKENIEEMIEV